MFSRASRIVNLTYALIHKLQRKKSVKNITKQETTQFRLFNQAKG